jgi:D-alanyl-D-alanine dipeptidase
MTAEITQLVPIIKRKALDINRPWHRFPIKDCGEPLVSLEALGGLAFESPAPYKAVGAPYGERGPYYLRQGAAERLKRAQEKLSILKPGWKIRVFDALRPVAVQEYMVAHEFYNHARKKGLDPFKLDAATQDALLNEVYNFWAPPSDNPATPPIHSCGGAFDCTLQNEKGVEIPMGSPIDHIGPESAPAYFAGRADPASQIYDENRRLLYHILSNEGFHRHPGEWWHFSYGDPLWAWLAAEAGETDVTVIYGRIA